MEEINVGNAERRNLIYTEIQSIANPPDHLDNHEPIPKCLSTRPNGEEHAMRRLHVDSGKLPGDVGNDRGFGSDTVNTGSRGRHAVRPQSITGDQNSEQQRELCIRSLT